MVPRLLNLSITHADKDDGHDEGDRANDEKDQSLIFITRTFRFNRRFVAATVTRAGADIKLLKVKYYRYIYRSHFIFILLTKI